MKLLICVAANLIAVSCFAQILDMERDTIQMQNVTLKREKAHYRKKTVRLEGTCYYAEDMWETYEIVTLLQGLPEGYLETITFTFNGLYSSEKEQREHFSPSELELVFYEVGDDGAPASEMYQEGKTVKLDKSYMGRTAIDVSALNIKSEGSMFVGIRQATPTGKKKAFSISCLCNGQDRYVTMVRKSGADLWSRRWECAALKTDITVLVKK